MTVGEARRMLAYSAWANARFIATANAMATGLADASVLSSFSSLRATLGHVVASEWIWLQRWQGESPAAAPAWGRDGSLAELEAHLEAVGMDRDRLLASLADADLERPLEYRSLAGGIRRSPLGDTISHVTLHSSHHRGQAATQMRQLGAVPPNAAFLEWSRAREAEKRDELLAELAAMPDFLADRLGALSADLARQAGPGETFSPVEQCWHLADLEAEGFGARIRLVLSEQKPFLPDFDGARVSRERNYRAKGLAEGLAAFRVARRSNLALLRGVSEAGWSRSGVQEGVDEVTLADLPRLMRDHDGSHRAEIVAWCLAHSGSMGA
jgi:uncharacterized damage-inducible protein DinB